MSKDISKDKSGLLILVSSLAIFFALFLVIIFIQEKYFPDQVSPIYLCEEEKIWNSPKQLNPILIA